MILSNKAFLIISVDESFCPVELIESNIFCSSSFAFKQTITHNLLSIIYFVNSNKSILLKLSFISLLK